MKRICFIIAMLMAMALQANAQNNHWSVNPAQFPSTMTINGIIVIDGVEQMNTNIEIGAFVGDVCHGSARLTADYYSVINHYLVLLSIYGTSGEQLSFRLYDHSLGQELDLNCSNAVTFTANAILGGVTDPYVFDFYSVVVTHTISVTTNPAAGGSVTGAGEYDHGEDCTLTATANQGYVFSNWTENGVVVCSYPNYTFTVINDRNLVANFTDIPATFNINVTVNPAEGGSVSGTGEYQQGSSCTLTATPNDGYMFSNWMENGNTISTDSEYTFTVVGDRNLVANFEEASDEYHWSVNINQFATNMTVIGIITINGVEQQNTDLEIGAFNGNECRGREKLTPAPLFNHYLVYMAIYGNNGEPITFKLYDHATEQELDLICYSRVNYSPNATLGGPSLPYVFEFSDSVIMHTITTSVNPANSGTVTGGGEIERGQICTLTATANEGYTFDKWTENGNPISSNTTLSFTVNNDRNLVANFTDTPVEYTVNVSANPTEGGTVSGGGTALQGTLMTVTATANEGYEFVSWTENGVTVSTSSTFSFILVGDRDLVANFEAFTPDEYHWHVNISQYANNMSFLGVIVIDNMEQSGTNLEIGAFCNGECRGREKLTDEYLATVNRYMVFLTVYGNNGDPINFRLYDHSIGQELDLICFNDNTVTFAANNTFGDPLMPYVFDFATTIVSHTITAVVNPANSGTVTGAGEYDHGSSCTLTATANTGFTFEKWTETDGTILSYEPSYTFNVTGDKTVVANFTNTPVMYGISVMANPAEGGYVSGGGQHLQGTECTVIATPNVGYTFVGWVENNETVSTEAAYTFTVTHDRFLVAVFAMIIPDGYHWTFNPNLYPNTMSIIGIINIDGVEQTGTDLEIGAFCGDECRGREKLTNEYYQLVNHYLVFLTIYGNSGHEITFKLYDHATEQELDLTCYSNIIFVANGTLGDPLDPFVFDFASAPMMHEINAFVNPVGAGNITGAGTFEHGQTCTLTATANEGYTFDKWTEIDGTVISLNPVYTFTVNADRTLVARFTDTPVEYTVTALANPPEGGTVNVSGNGTFVQSDECTVTATANAGFYFNGWTENGEIVSMDAEYTFHVTHNTNLLANFATIIPDGYHWTVNIAQYPTSMTAIGVIVIDGAEQTGTDLEIGAFCGNECRGREKLSADYYSILGRYLVFLTIYGNDGNQFTFRLYDHVTEQELDLNCSNDGLVFVTNMSLGDATTPYVFDFYSELVAHTVSAVVNPANSGTVSGTGEYDHGTECTLTATANLGYTFDMWTTTDGTVLSLESTITFTVISDQTLVAHFTDTPTMYGISVMANPAEGGTVTGGGQHLQGTECTVTANANSGYTFSNWTENGNIVSTNAAYTFTVTGNRNLVANFTEVPAGYHWNVNENAYPNTMTITAYIQIDGVEQFSDVLEVGAFCGDECRGRERASDVYYSLLNHYFVFMTVYGNANNPINFRLYDHSLGEELEVSCPGTIFVVNGALGDPVDPYVFNFMHVVNYTVTATATEGGIVTGGGIYEENTECTLTAIANDDHYFLNWTEDGVVVSEEPEYSFIVTSDRNLVANFMLNSYDITVVAHPAMGGTVTGSGTYFHGQSCTLTAEANEEFSFVNWTKDNVELTTELTYTFTVIQEGTYTANFERNTVTQTTPINTGWNWYSTYIEQSEEFNGLQMLKQSLDQQGIGLTIKSQNKYTDYSSILHMWIGNLTNLTNEQSYQIRTSGDGEIELTGPAINPEEHPITLKHGWNWIGYPCYTSMPVITALANINPQHNDQLKSANSYTTYNGMLHMWIGNLTTLTPGMGLLFLSNDNDDVTLVYPAIDDRSAAAVESVTFDDNYWTVDRHAYPSNMTVTAVVELEDVELASERYEVAAFANGECRGSAKLMYVEPLNRYMAFLLVSGDEDVNLSFSLYDSETGAVETCHGASLQYSTNAVVGDTEDPFVISFRSTTGTDEFGSRLQVYPNPVERGHVISLGLTDDNSGEVRVEIINAYGVLVETICTPSLQTITAPGVPGIYTLRITNSKGTHCRKLVVR